MEGRILNITEAVPKATALPDGIYSGIWGGYVIVIRYNNKVYEARTEEGVRGVGFKVVVTIEGDKMEFKSINN